MEGRSVAPMDTDPKAPWNPRVGASICPTDFEKLVERWLRGYADHEGYPYTVEHLGRISGDGGTYVIDVLFRFSILGGVELVVLVECKHQRRPVERQDLMVLESKLRSTSASKGILVSTSGFQSGAIEFARSRKIATVIAADHSWTHLTKSFRTTSFPAQHSPNEVEQYVGILVTQQEDANILCQVINDGEFQPLNDWLKTHSEVIYDE